MTTSSAITRNDYVGNASATSFVYQFKIFSESEIDVYLDGVLQPMSAYTVSGVGDNNGGNVLFNTAPALGVKVTLISAPSFLQEIDYVEADRFPAESHERGLDRAAVRDLALLERIERSLALPVELTGVSNALPSPVANNLLGWNAAADALENKSGAPDIVLPSFSGNAGLPAVVNALENNVEFVQLTSAGIEDNAITTAKILDTNVTRTKLADALYNVLRMGHGRCRLVLDGANLRLNPFDGNTIIINGELETIPDAGVALSASGTANNTAYNIYAYMNAGTVTLEYSTTGTAVQAGTGVLIKSGDATRTFVGLAYVVSAGSWSTNIFDVRSWFNEPRKVQETVFTADRSTTSTSLVELNTEIRQTVLLFSNEAIDVSAIGACYSAAGVTNATLTAIRVGSTEYSINISTHDVINKWQPFSLCREIVPGSPGRYVVTLAGRVNGGTGNWRGVASGNERSTLTVALGGRIK